MQTFKDTELQKLKNPEEWERMMREARRRSGLQNVPYQKVDYTKLDEIIEVFSIFTEELVKLEEDFYENATYEKKDINYIELIKICNDYRETDISEFLNWYLKNLGRKKPLVAKAIIKLNQSIEIFSAKSLTLEKFWDILTNITNYVVFTKILLKMLKLANDEEKNIILNAIAKSRF